MATCGAQLRTGARQSADEFFQETTELIKFRPLHGLVCIVGIRCAVGSKEALDGNTRPATPISLGIPDEVLGRGKEDAREAKAAATNSE